MIFSIIKIFYLIFNLCYIISIMKINLFFFIFWSVNKKYICNDKKQTNKTKRKDQFFFLKKICS